MLQPGPIIYATKTGWLIAAKLLHYTKGGNAVITCNDQKGKKQYVNPSQLFADDKAALAWIKEQINV